MCKNICSWIELEMAKDKQQYGILILYVLGNVASAADKIRWGGDSRIECALVLWSISGKTGVYIWMKKCIYYYIYNSLHTSECSLNVSIFFAQKLTFHRPKSFERTTSEEFDASGIRRYLFCMDISWHSVSFIFFGIQWNCKIFHILSQKIGMKPALATSASWQNNHAHLTCLAKVA